jgi:hypothetical protein
MFIQSGHNFSAIPVSLLPAFKSMYLGPVVVCFVKPALGEKRELRGIWRRPPSDSHFIGTNADRLNYALFSMFYAFGYRYCEISSDQNREICTDR